MFRRQHKALGANPKKKNEQDSLSKTSSNLSPVSVLDDQLESVPCNEETQLPILTPKRATSYEIQQDTQLPSLVIVSDAGAEVTLENHVKKALRTPSKSKRKESILTTPTSRHRSCKNLPTNSLFDDEEQLSTPSPSPQKKGSIFFCNGASSCYRPDNTSLSITTKKPYEHTICTMLGSPVGVNDWCSGWQAWTYYEINVPTDHQMGLKEDVRRVLRNRVTNTNSRFKHIRTLKRDLHPFDRTPEKARVQLSKTLSFPAQTVLPHNKNTSIPSNNDAPFVIRTRGLDTSDGFYDSDPEESTKRRSRRRCKSSRLPNDFKQPTSPLRTVDFCDEEGVNQVVQVRMNTNVILSTIVSNAQIAGDYQCSLHMGVASRSGKGQSRECHTGCGLSMGRTGPTTLYKAHPTSARLVVINGCEGECRASGYCARPRSQPRRSTKIPFGASEKVIPRGVPQPKNGLSSEYRTRERPLGAWAQDCHCETGIQNHHGR